MVRFTMAASVVALLSTAIGCGQANRAYFPVGALWPSTPENDDQLRRSLSGYLQALDEPVLWTRKYGESIRLLQTLGGNTVRVVRVDGTPGKPTIRAIEYIGDRPGRILKQRERDLSAKDWLEAVSWLDKIAFWSLAAEIGDVQLDGHPVTLERASAGRYHVVLRYSNDDGVRDVERRLLSLAGLWCLPPEVQCHN